MPLNNRLAAVRVERVVDPDLIARIFHVDLMLLEVAESFSERGHIRQVKGHVAECVRRWPAFMQCDRDIVIAHRDAAFKSKQLL